MNKLAKASLVVTVLLLSCACGNLVSEPEGKDSEGARKSDLEAGEAKDKGKGSTSGNAEDPSTVVQGPDVPTLFVEVRGDTAFDFAVTKATIAGKTSFESDAAARIGITDIYYGATLVHADVRPATSAEVQGWGIASSGNDKSWLDTTCAPKRANEITTDICEIAGPIMDVKASIQDLPATATEQDVLGILTAEFPGVAFRVVAAGKGSRSAAGEALQAIELEAVGDQ